MNAGDAFFLGGKTADRHLWVIISDPAINPNRVLFVSMTSYDVTKEDVWLIGAGEHPFVTHTTCIAYWNAREASLDELEKLRNAGQLRRATPISSVLLARIRTGVSLSRDIKLGFVELMEGQALLD